MVIGVAARDSRTNRTVWLFGFGFIVALVLAEAIAVTILRDREIETWRRQMSSMSLMLAEQTAQTMFSAYAALDAVAEQVRRVRAKDSHEFRSLMGRPEIHDMLRDRVRGLPRLDVATIVADNGDIVNLTRSYPPPPINLADRDYFQAHAASRRLGDYVSTAVRNRGNNQWTFYISRRIDDAQGNFLGVVILGLSVQAFTRFYQGVVDDLGAGASIGLFRDDLTLLARAPHIDEVVGKVNRSGSTFEAHELMTAQNRDDAVVKVDTPRFSTGESVLRLAAVRKVAHFPLIVSLIVDDEILLANWRRSAQLVGVVTAAVVAILLLGLAALTRNLRRRELAEQESRTSRQLLDSVVENIPTMIFAKRADDLRFALFNRAGEELLGHSRDDLLGRNDYDFFPKEQADFFTAMDRRVLAQYGVVDIPEEPIETPKGTRILHTRKVTLRDERGEPAFLLGISQDITERKENERQLARAKEAAEAASLAKSQFLATMSHEIRTPMNGILGMAQLLLMPGLDEADRQDYVRTILSSGQTLLALLNDILDLSKVEAGKIELVPAVFEPGLIVHETAALFGEPARAKGLSIEFAWEGEADARYRADPVRVRQMLSNLVANAVKFTSAGRVRIEAREILDDGKTFLEFAVSDTGIGIAADMQQRLFQPFSQVDSSSTRRHGGTGLGLSIVRSLARLMGGEVGVESGAGMGARFWFRICAERVRPGEESRAAERAGAGQETAAASEVANHGVILVVEDNVTNRRVVEGLLEKLGRRSYCVADGAQAVDAIAGGAAFDLVLMDCRMPVLDGFTATERIRRWEAEHGAVRVPIIALTAGAYDEDRQRCLDAGMDDFLAKPLNVRALATALRKWRPRDSRSRG